MLNYPNASLSRRESKTPEQMRNRSIRPYQICRRCIMDTSDPDIQFDEAGNCNHCVNYLRRCQEEVVQGEAGEQKLKQVVAKIKQDGTGKEYDCVIGVSGGVDSTATAYYV